MPSKRTYVSQRVKSRPAKPQPSIAVLLTCEHAGNRVPAKYAHLFRGHDALLQSHRGWDPGARPLAKFLAKAHGWPLFEALHTRLLIEANRTLRSPQLFSSITDSLSDEEKQSLIDRYYHPHRMAIETWIEKAIQKKQRVLHLGIHTFTPNLDGNERNCEVAFLYNPRRDGECTFCARWKETLKQAASDLRIRMNYPYRGDSDGLTFAFRKQYPDEQYIGIELEVNQKLPLGQTAEWRKVCRAISQSLPQAIAT
jgi:predicted N-formylglutamate amidohydrolase